MEFLLDTHALLYLLSEPERLNAGLLSELQERQVYVSAVTIWEISIKVGLSKLELPDDFFDCVAELEIDELSITHAHAREVLELERIHSDPFDRMIIAQARVENLVIVTNDSQIQQYAKIHTRW
jgi:PIN domain nuclease of toxin-antitoxin system